MSAPTEEIRYLSCPIDPNSAVAIWVAHYSQLSLADRMKEDVRFRRALVNAGMLVEPDTPLGRVLAGNDATLGVKVSGDETIVPSYKISKSDAQEALSTYALKN